MGQHQDDSQGDRLSFSTERDYKCSQCGNMYPTSAAECDVCGNHCTPSTCRIVEASSEDY